MKNILYLLVNQGLDNTPGYHIEKNMMLAVVAKFFSEVRVTFTNKEIETNLQSLGVSLLLLGSKKVYANVSFKNVVKQNPDYTDIIGHPSRTRARHTMEPLTTSMFGMHIRDPEDMGSEL